MSRQADGKLPTIRIHHRTRSNMALKILRKRQQSIDRPGDGHPLLPCPLPPVTSPTQRLQIFLHRLTPCRPRTDMINVQLHRRVGRRRPAAAAAAEMVAAEDAVSHGSCYFPPGFVLHHRFARISHQLNSDRLSLPGEKRCQRVAERSEARCVCPQRIR
jgi:hypothetical protein